MANGKPGAPKGSKNRLGKPGKKSLAIEEKLAALGCDPIEGMARIAAIAEENEDYDLAVSCYKELAQYVAPKRKAVEHSGLNGGPIQISRIERVIVDDNNSIQNS